MDLVHQQAEVRLAAVLRVHGAVVAVGIGAAEASLLPLHTDGMDGQQPDHVRAEGADAVELGRVEGGLRGVAERAVVDEHRDRIVARADRHGVGDADQRLAARVEELHVDGQRSHPFQY